MYKRQSPARSPTRARARAFARAHPVVNVGDDEPAAKADVLAHARALLRERELAAGGAAAATPRVTVPRAKAPAAPIAWLAQLLRPESDVAARAAAARARARRARGGSKRIANARMKELLELGADVAREERRAGGRAAAAAAARGDAADGDLQHPNYRAGLRAALEVEERVGMSETREAS